MDQGKILVIEDNAVDAAFLCDVLSGSGFEVAVTQKGEDGLALLPIFQPTLIILDIMLPDIDGYEICRRIRRHEKCNAVPVLFYTNVSGIDEKLLGYELGASDFLTKNANRQEVMLRVRALLKTKEALDYLSQLSFYDSVTEIYNRRYFQQRLSEEVKRCGRYRRSFCCAMFDVDDFKRINDAHGHLAGDRVLRRIAKLLRECVSSSDVVCRFGGDEFVILLPEISLADALVLVQRICLSVEKNEIQITGAVLRSTVSCGLCPYTADISSPEDVVAQADAALYEAKHQGKNQVRAFCSSALAG